jgi:hypothetical protein
VEEQNQLPEGEEQTEDTGNVMAAQSMQQLMPHADEQMQQMCLAWYWAQEIIIKSPKTMIHRQLNTPKKSQATREPDKIHQQMSHQRSNKRRSSP